VATEAEVAQLFESLRPRIAEIQGRDSGKRGGGIFGCLLMVLPFAAALGMVVKPEVVTALRGWPLLVAPVIGVAVFYIGFKMWRPWQAANSAQRAEADAALLQPLAALLLPGATFTRAPIMLSRQHPSLLMPRPEGVTSTSCGRIEGLLLGRPIRIDELLLASGHMGARWVVRVELPFVLAGHVRIHRRTKLDPGRFWREGFEPLEEESRRLGAHVEMGPLGIGSEEGLAAPPPGAVPPGAVLTHGLFVVLGERRDVSVAAAGRTLWVVVERAIHAFDDRVPDEGLVDRWHQAAIAMQDVEDVTREVLAAAGVRS
jgi:hypothetical protein